MINTHTFEVLKPVIDNTPDVGLIYLLDKAISEEQSDLVDYLLDVMNERKRERAEILKELSCAVSS